MSKAVEYELLARELYQILLEAEGLTTVKVQHNVIIIGKAHKHQIDVYWEYEFNGSIRRFAIECKDYNSTISIGKVRDFYGALIDIGDINGIMVTKVGYQKGAKEYAKYYGINLKEIREPIEADWDGRVKETFTKMTVIDPPFVTDVMVVVDELWAKENIPNGNFSTVGYPSAEIWVIDGSGNHIKSVVDMAQELPYGEQTGKGLQHCFWFQNGYVRFKDYGSVGIKGIGMTYNVAYTTYQFSTDATLTAKVILKDVFSGEIEFFHKDGKS